MNVQGFPEAQTASQYIDLARGQLDGLCYDYLQLNTTRKVVRDWDRLFHHLMDKKDSATIERSSKAKRKVSNTAVEEWSGAGVKMGPNVHGRSKSSWRCSHCRAASTRDTSSGSGHPEC